MANSIYFSGTALVLHPYTCSLLSWCFFFKRDDEMREDWFWFSFSWLRRKFYFIVFRRNQQLRRLEYKKTIWWSAPALATEPFVWHIYTLCESRWKWKIKIPRQHKINNNIAPHYKNENIPSFYLLSDQPIRYVVVVVVVFVFQLLLLLLWLLFFKRQKATKLCPRD